MSVDDLFVLLRRSNQLQPLCVSATSFSRSTANILVQDTNSMDVVVDLRGFRRVMEDRNAVHSACEDLASAVRLMLSISINDTTSVPLSESLRYAMRVDSMRQHWSRIRASRARLDMLSLEMSRIVLQRVVDRNDGGQLLYSDNVFSRNMAKCAASEVQYIEDLQEHVCAASPRGAFGRLRIIESSFIPALSSAKRAVYEAREEGTDARIAVAVVAARELARLQSDGNAYERHLNRELALHSALHRNGGNGKFANVYIARLETLGASCVVSNAENFGRGARILAVENLVAWEPLSSVIGEHGCLGNRANMCLLRIWCRQILLALSFLHESNVILLRLRPTNILVSPCGRCIKIASLDGAGHIDGPFVICSDDAREKSEVLNDAYMPPEMLHADGSRVQPCTFFGDAAFRPSKEVDSWCFGCLMLEMASGRSPVSYGTLLQRTLDSHTAPPTALLPYIFLDAFGFCEDGDSSSARGERVLLSPPPTWKCTSNTVSWTSLASMQIALGAKTLGPLLALPKHHLTL